LSDRVELLGTHDRDRRDVVGDRQLHVLGVEGDHGAVLLPAVAAGRAALYRSSSWSSVASGSPPVARASRIRADAAVWNGMYPGNRGRTQDCSMVASVDR